MTDTSGNPLTGLADAGDAMSDFLSDDLVVDTGETVVDGQRVVNEQPAPKPKTPVKAEDEDEEEGDEAPEASDETPEKPEAKAEDDEGEDEGEADADKEDDEEAPEGTPQTVTVKIDGKDVEVPLEEAVRGYQRQADYSRKTQALSDDRKAFDSVRQEFETNERQPLLQERAQYKVLLGQLSKALDDLAPQEPDWQELLARDKNEYLLQRDNWRAIQEQREAVKAEADRVAGVEQQERAKAFNAQVQKGIAQLNEWEPKWKDPAVRQADFAKVFKYAKDVLGYSDQDIANANDHRSLYAVYKAMKLDELQAQAATVKNQAVKKGQKVLKAGGADTTPAAQGSRNKKNAMTRLVKGGGRFEDAAGIMEGFLDV